MSETDIKVDITWTPLLEDYFKEIGEKCSGLSYLHKKAEQLYSVRRTWIDLPVIVISAVTGFLSAGSTSMFSDPKVSSVALGVASLFVSVLNTAGSYFGWSRRAEGHRISAIQYSKLCRFLTIEMSLPREERMTAHDLLKQTKDQYDRLAEISPLIPALLIEEFKKTFAKITDIAHPDETNGLDKIVVHPAKSILTTRHIDATSPTGVASPTIRPDILDPSSVQLRSGAE